MSSCPLLLTIFSFEESLLHVFHTFLHKVNEANKKKSFPRVQEFFTYAHQQITRRAAVERELAGLPELVPLGDPVSIRQSLGPGYRAGWYKWATGMAGRKDDCKMQENPNSTYALEKLEEFDGLHSGVLQKMQDLTGDDLEAFAAELSGGGLSGDYHGQGHLNMGELCHDSTNPGDVGVMGFIETSAR